MLTKGGDGLRNFANGIHLLTTQEHYQEGIMAFSFTGTLFTGLCSRKSGNKYLFASSFSLQIQDFDTLGQTKTDRWERINSRWDPGNNWLNRVALEHNLALVSIILNV